VVPIRLASDERTIQDPDSEDWPSPGITSSLKEAGYRSADVSLAVFEVCGPSVGTALMFCVVFQVRWAIAVRNARCPRPRAGVRLPPITGSDGQGMVACQFDPRRFCHSINELREFLTDADCQGVHVG
jgi:hypothetical protein